jgi:hypothetical protein
VVFSVVVFSVVVFSVVVLSISSALTGLNIAPLMRQQTDKNENAKVNFMIHPPVPISVKHFLNDQSQKAVIGITLSCL